MRALAGASTAACSVVVALADAHRPPAMPAMPAARGAAGARRLCVSRHQRAAARALSARHGRGAPQAHTAACMSWQRACARLLPASLYSPVSLSCMHASRQHQHQHTLPQVFALLGLHEFLPSSEMLSKLEGQLCETTPALCVNLLAAICGWAACRRRANPNSRQTRTHDASSTLRAAQANRRCCSRLSGTIRTTLTPPGCPSTSITPLLAPASKTWHTGRRCARAAGPHSVELLLHPATLSLQADAAAPALLPSTQAVRQRGASVMRQYDYGTDCRALLVVPRPCNQAVYGQLVPPVYNLSAIARPLALFTGACVWCTCWRVPVRSSRLPRLPLMHVQAAKTGWRIREIRRSCCTYCLRAN